MLRLRRLDAAALGGLGREELVGVLGDIERLTNQLAGYRAEVLGALDGLSRSGAAPDASPHLSLRDAAGVSEREARSMTRVAEKARGQVPVLEALNAGSITPSQAEALCDARVPDGVRDELVAAAAAEDADATRRRIRQAEAEHSAETPMERFERQRQMRGAGWRRDHEGMLKLWARFDPSTGAQIEALLEPLRRELWADDKQLRNGRRSPAQRDADVLAYALAGITSTEADTEAVNRLHARALHRGRGSGGQPPSDGASAADAHAEAAGRLHADTRHHERDISKRPRSRRTTPRKTVTDMPTDGGAGERPSSRRAAPREDAAKDGATEGEQPGQAAAESQRGGDGGMAIGPRLPAAQISVLINLDALRGTTDDLGLTDAGTELPPEIVRQLACDAEIIPMVLGGRGGPCDVGHARRTVPLRLRRLLIARDRHCQWPGCSAPPSRCDAHHIIHWANGGPTNLDNLVLLCHTHHRFLHQHGYRMVPQPDGTWMTVKESDHQPAPQRSKRQARAP